MIASWKTQRTAPNDSKLEDTTYRTK